MEGESNFYISVMTDMKKNIHTVCKEMMQRWRLKSNMLLGKIASIKVLSFPLCSTWEGHWFISEDKQEQGKIFQNKTDTYISGYYTSSLET